MRYAPVAINCLLRVRVLLLLGSIDRTDQLRLAWLRTCVSADWCTDVSPDLRHSRRKVLGGRGCSNRGRPKDPDLQSAIDNSNLEELATMLHASVEEVAQRASEKQDATARWQVPLLP